ISAPPWLMSHRRVTVKIPQVGGGAEFKIVTILKMPPASRRDRKFGSASEMLAPHRRQAEQFRPDGH
ncbi:MAG TPA: hypothetical protein VJ723_13825, partial [Candidatus Angelobacter sp.]|nr:hypothetical protein [Candidatus Angelobacter sp.]